MADKTWDILNFLKNPPGESMRGKNTTTRGRIRQIDEPREDAIENPRPEPAQAANKETVGGIAEDGEISDKNIEKNVLVTVPDSRKPVVKDADEIHDGKIHNEEVNARVLDVEAKSRNERPLLGDIATLVNKHKSRGIMAQWRVKQMNQSSLVVEITVDLMRNASEDEDVSA
ncbi:MAG: hypothetical protein LBU13_02890 [Synergistaceae bacterium]|nr:hypothetical protein [Synergistaceae bacterium]